MDILIEYYHILGHPIHRSIITERPNIGDIVQIDKQSYKVTDCHLNKEIWKSSGLLSFTCKVIPHSSTTILERLSSMIAKESPLQVTMTDVYNSNGFGGERGDFMHDENNYYLVLVSFDVEEDSEIFEKELNDFNEIESPFDLKLVWFNGDEYIHDKSLFKLRLNYPWMITPKEMKERDGYASTVIEAIVEKNKYPEFEKFYSSSLDCMQIDGDIPYDEVIDSLNFDA